MRSRCALLALCLAVTASSADAVTLETRVSASSGDAEQNAATGAMNLTSSDLELVTDGSTVQVVGVRFPDLAIPGGATITAAWVQFTTDSVRTGATSLTLQGDLTQQSPSFTTTPGNVSSRPRTSASVAWLPAPWLVVGEQGPDQRTPSLVPILQERVNASDWTPGDAFTLIITGTGRRNAVSWEANPAEAALLHVEFEPPSNLPPVLSVARPLAGTTAIAGTALDFAASANDPENGDLSGSIHWTSDRDGILGIGAAFSRADLSVGVHMLTVEVSDGQGGVATRVRTLTIFAPSNEVVAVGDIGDCDSPGDDATGALVETLPGTIFALGDLAYDNGSTAEFANCFEPTWGRHKSRIVPVIGNHEYLTPGAAPYFAYFGAVAGTPGAPWRSFDLSGWHVVSLDSNCGEVGGCDADSPQGQWLEADLSANSKPCTLALLHHPRFASGFEGIDDSLLDFWQILYTHGVDVVLAGHDHAYERFARMNPNGGLDPTRGIRSITSGAGGTGLHGAEEDEINSEVRNEAAFGVLRLVLEPTSYSWQFHGAGPGVFNDSGSEECVYGAPAVTITSPAGGTVFPSGATVNFAATASDLEQGSLASSLAWTSSRDGELGSGASLATTLSSGGHVITALVTDETGLTGSAKVSLTVSLPPGAACGIGPELIIVLLGLLAGSAGVQRASRATPKRSQ